MERRDDPWRDQVVLPLAYPGWRRAVAALLFASVASALLLTFHLATRYGSVEPAVEEASPTRVWVGLAEDAPYRSEVLEGIEGVEARLVAHLDEVDRGLLAGVPTAELDQCLSGVADPGAMTCELGGREASGFEVVAQLRDRGELGDRWLRYVRAAQLEALAERGMDTALLARLREAAVAAGTSIDAPAVLTVGRGRWEVAPRDEGSAVARDAALVVSQAARLLWIALGLLVVAGAASIPLLWPRRVTLEILPQGLRVDGVWIPVGQLLRCELRRGALWIAREGAEPMRLGPLALDTDEATALARRLDALVRPEADRREEEAARRVVEASSRELLARVAR